MVGEEQITALGHTESDCPVKLYNSGMSRGREGGEQLADVFAICNQFGSTVGEDKDRGLPCGVAGNDPLGVSSDDAGRGRRAGDELEVPQFLSALFVEGDGVQGREDTVEVDSLSSKEVCPLTVGELRAPWR